jgi:hypothetical protein
VWTGASEDSSTICVQIISPLTQRNELVTFMSVSTKRMMGSFKVLEWRFFGHAPPVGPGGAHNSSLVDLHHHTRRTTELSEQGGRVYGMQIIAKI